MIQDCQAFVIVSDIHEDVAHTLEEVREHYRTVRPTSTMFPLAWLVLKDEPKQYIESGQVHFTWPNHPSLWGITN